MKCEDLFSLKNKKKLSPAVVVIGALRVQGNGYTFKRTKVLKFLTCFKKGVYSKEKNLLPLGANSFLLELTPFRRGLVCSKASRKPSK